MQRFFLLISLVVGCRDSAYLRASKTDTSAAYREFLNQNPTDENAETAQQRLSELELESARKVHTVIAYKRYLDEFPQSEGAKTARALLEGLRFNAAASRGTALAYRQFISDHPEGAHREEAEKALQKAELAELASLEKEDLAQVAITHADDERGSQAMQRLDNETFQHATLSRDWYDYLKKFPAGLHRDHAKVKLLGLELKGLWISGHLSEAKALAQRSPLAAKVPKLSEQFRRAEEEEAVRRSKEATLQRAQPQFYLRSFDDLLAAAKATDPMDRWEAVFELGEYVDIKAIDPLLEALRASRHPLVREHAFASLARLFKALPSDVAEYEISTRVQRLEAQATDSPVVLTLAALLDLAGQRSKAAQEYQRGFNFDAPDPVVLNRWVTIRNERREAYSAAVAAKQLSAWSAQQLRDVEFAAESSLLAQSRTLCAARYFAQAAHRGIKHALDSQPEFIDDVKAFELGAQHNVRLIEAKLRDTELKLWETEPHVRSCDDTTLAQRLASSEEQRLLALQKIVTNASPKARLVVELARQRDPSAVIRTALAQPH